MTHNKELITSPLILFDGVCNLCNTSVQFILTHESGKKLHFASLQSEWGKEVLDRFRVSHDLSSMVFIEEGRMYTKSEAVLRVSKYLVAPWNWARIFLILPGFLRDGVYDIVARNRYRWFGKKEQCEWIPGVDMERFLDV